MNNLEKFREKETKTMVNDKSEGKKENLLERTMGVRKE